MKKIISIMHYICLLQENVELMFAKMNLVLSKSFANSPREKSCIIEFNKSIADKNCRVTVKICWRTRQYGKINNLLELFIYRELYFLIMAARSSARKLANEQRMINRNSSFYSKNDPGITKNNIVAKTSCDGYCTDVQIAGGFDFIISDRNFSGKYFENITSELLELCLSNDESFDSELARYISFISQETDLSEEKIHIEMPKANLHVPQDC